jgi:hypothetical protein
MVSVDEETQEVIAIENYIPKDPTSCLGFSEGQRAIVLEKSGGWWFVKIGTDEGWVPGTFFEPVMLSLEDAPHSRPRAHPHPAPRRSPQSSPLIARKRFTDPDEVAEPGEDLVTGGKMVQSKDLSKVEQARSDRGSPSLGAPHVQPRAAVAGNHSPVPQQRTRIKSPMPGMEDLANQVWYHGQMSRADAEMILMTVICYEFFVAIRLNSLYVAWQ